MSTPSSGSITAAQGTGAELVSQLDLEPHPEGGFFKLTWLADAKVPSPFARNNKSDVSSPDGTAESAQDRMRAVGSCIYYLLAKDQGHGLPSEKARDLKGWSSSKANFHINASPTMHLHHSGRSRYLLIEAGAPWGSYDSACGRPPRVREVIMGPDAARGETRQLLVESGWWKVSMLPEGEEHALISEVLTPAFDWADHAYMREEDLDALFPEDAEARARFAEYLRET